MIKILVDSSAYLLRREASEMDVALAPLTYSSEEGAMFTEGYLDENLAFDRSLGREHGKMHTSQVTYAVLYNTFQSLCDKGHDVLCMTMSSRLSGTYANARMAAERATGNVLVVDSKTTAGAFYLLVKKAHHFLSEGCTLAEVERKLFACRERIRTFFSVDDIAALRNSGRLGNVKMSVSTILNVRPILKLENGGVTSHSVVRGKDEQMRALISMVPKGAGEVIVQHNHAPSRANLMAAELKKMGCAPCIRKIGPVLAIHLGEGAVGISFEEE